MFSALKRDKKPPIDNPYPCSGVDGLDGKAEWFRAEDAMKDEDDALSISSLSTNATMDNNPGPGRLIDTYIYQRLGRKIERFAARINISTLHPSQIVQRLNLRPTPWRTYLDGSTDETIKEVSLLHGSEVVAGLKCLVRQTRSVLQLTSSKR